MERRVKDGIADSDVVTDVCGRKDNESSIGQGVHVWACYRGDCDDYLVFFFFQAEDGIRDYKVTGVQTCALPIFLLIAAGNFLPRGAVAGIALEGELRRRDHAIHGRALRLENRGDAQIRTGGIRSEERRVGKECRSRWSPYH